MKKLGFQVDMAKNCSLQVGAARAKESWTLGKCKPREAGRDQLTGEDEGQGQSVWLLPRRE